MEIIQSIFQYIINLGASVFLPALITVLGIILGMKPGKAFSSGLTLGVAFVGINQVMALMNDSVGVAAQAFVENTGISLTALDMGWPPAVAIVWAWQYAFLLFPIQILINVVMLSFKWTNCLNVDMWNVVNKVITAFLVTYVTNNPIIGMVVAAIQVVLELKHADYTQYRLQKLSGIPGISMPHPLFLSAIIYYPLVKLMDKILPENVNIDANKLRNKIGIFGENHVMGFIIGCLIGIMAGYEFGAVLTLGVQAGTALTLFPMVAKLFTTALSPLSDTATKFMKNKFKDRTFSIGLDWPVLAGRSEIWLVIIIAIPIIFLTSIFLPGNIVLPFGGLVAAGLVAPLFFVTKGNILQMLILLVIAIPIHLYSATYFAPFFTELAVTTGVVGLPEGGQLIAWFGMDMAEIRWILTAAFEMNIWAIVALVVFVGLTFYFLNGMKKEDIEIAKELGIDLKANKHEAV